MWNNARIQMGDAGDRLVRSCHVGELAAELDRSQWLSADELQHRQWQKLQQLLAHAYASVPYYQELFRNLGTAPPEIRSLRDFQQLPVLTRSILQQQGHQFVSRTSSSKCLPDQTRGSTGEPVLFSIDDHSRDMRLAVARRFDSWTGWHRGEKVLQLLSLNILNRQVYRPHPRRRARHWFESRRVLNFADYTLAELVRQMNEYRPSLIVAEANPIYELARHLLANEPLTQVPQAVVCSAEPLFDFQRKAIEQAFRCPVFNRYGSQEVGLIAAECDRHAGLHVAVDSVLLELLPSVSPPLDPTLQAVVVTDLNNHAYPFIRYQIGDLAALKSPGACGCGRQLTRLERVAGRVGDCLRSQDGQIVAGQQLVRIFDNIPEIRRFQLLQSAPNRVSVRLLANRTPAVDARIFSDLRQVLGSGLEVDLDDVDSLTPSPSGKFRYVINLMPGEIVPARAPDPIVSRRRAQAAATLSGRIFRNVLWASYEQLRGRNTVALAREAQRAQWDSAEKIEQGQWLALQNLLEHSFQHSPWYRRQFSALGITPKEIRTRADLLRFPILTKADIRQHCDEMIADNYRHRVFRHTTGGSTGSPLVFYLDSQSYRWRQAIRMRNYSWASALDGEKIVYLWGAPLSQHGRLDEVKKWLHNGLLRRTILNTYELSEETAGQYVRAIAQQSPLCIVGYTSSLVTLAKYIIRNHSEFEHPLSIIATAESLFEPQRALIMRAFGCPVFNSYGSREFMNIAMECDQHAGLHLNHANLLVEVLRNNQPVTDGSCGELVITDIYNYGMPMIRYRIGDLGSLADQPCPCGRGLPLLRSVEGRAFDTIVLPDGRLVSGLYFTGLLLDRYQDIEQLQAVQTQRDRVVVRMVLSPERQSRGQQFVQEVQQFLGPRVTVSAEFVATIPAAPSGKRRITISEIPVEI